MSLPEIDRPIIFVGAPRSGTTLVFNTFAARPDLAWFTQHLNRLPRWPAVTVLARLADLNAGLRKSIDRSDRRRHPLEKLRVGPSEAYGVWKRCCGDRFLFDFLHDQEASATERQDMRKLVGKLLRYEGKERFATKITGPARISYLSSIFPDARFVHVIRDGRAVVGSLLEVQFWRGTWREREVAWTGGLTDEELALWRERNQSPVVLAALQWRAVVRTAREEAQQVGDRYAEVHYEDFVAEPDAVLDEMATFCELPPSERTHDFLRDRVDIRDMNQRWREAFEPAEIEMLDELIGDELDGPGRRLAPAHY
jgi:Sulfotransferase family